ncbi:MAG: chitobiase/beta-hexosaminidase C-terminal domain-containing protein [Pirellulales bacterium]|nr:chitobiase/beta-hexosaminidase C-terminal domain-containing protein [Pirellulales bacterium]
MHRNWFLLWTGLVVWALGMNSSFGAEPASFELWTKNIDSSHKSAYGRRPLRVRISPEGKIVGVKLGADAAERPVLGETVLQDCRGEGVPQATRLDGGGVEFEKRFVDKAGQHHGTLVERFLPQAESIRWEVEIRGEGEPWSTPIETHFRWTKEGDSPNFPSQNSGQSPSLFWTAWGDPRPDGADWTDPLHPAAWADREFFYGGRRFKYFKEPSTFSLPLASILDEKQDAGLSLVLSPDDLVLTLKMRTTKTGDVTFSREHHRLGKDHVVRCALDLTAHLADWRGGLAWMAGRYSEYFNPPNPLVEQMAGCGAYSSHADITEVERLMRMAFRVNWKASFDFPYMGMFIPPVATDTEEWTDFMKKQTSVAKMRASAQTLRKLGFYLLNYFNVTEFGAYLQFPPPPRKAVADEDLWKDANDFTHNVMSQAVLPNADGKPIRSWEGCVVMDPGEKVYQDFLIEQARRHIEKFPESSGICIDRLDWIMEYNRQRDDGVTWLDGKPARCLAVSWHELLRRLGPLMHAAGKVIYVNPMYPRIDIVRRVDGFYDEHGQYPHSLNTCSILALNKPYMAWTLQLEDLDKDPDAYFQRHLHLGAYLTAPVPGNDHTILPDPKRDQYFFDYGPLMDCLRGKRWVLLPHVVRVEGDKALANVFEVPGGYVVPVTFGGKESSVQVVLQGLPHLPGQKIFRVSAFHPGDAKPVVLNAVEEGRSLKIDVPLVRGCAMLQVNYAWMEPLAAYFHDTVNVELGSTFSGEAAFHYTLDGSEPTPQSPRYSGPVELRQTTTVKAALFRDGRKLGRTLEREYVKIPPAKTVSSPSGVPLDDDAKATRDSPQALPDSPEFTLKTENLQVRLSPQGKILGVTLPGETAERPVTAETVLAGCRLEGAPQARRLNSGGIEFEKRFADKKGHRALLIERFLPEKDSIRWEYQVRSEGESWTAPLQTRVHWPGAQQSTFWTAWGDPRPKADGWSDPLRTAPWTNRRFTYGNDSCIKDANAFSLPLACLLDPQEDAGLSVVLSPEDYYAEMEMTITPQGDLTFSRLHHRFDKSNTVRGALDLVAHPADWRSGLGWMTRRYANFFDPPNPAVQQMAGCGAYSSHAVISEVERLMQMAFRVNWKASFDFPYMGLFLPPTESDTEEWIDFKKQKTSIAKMRAHSKDLRRLGFYVLNYFNVTECGAYYQYPPPPRRTKKDEDLWKDANDFLFYAVGDAILPGPDGKPIASWEGCVAMDPGEKVYQDFMMEQAQRHIDRIPESSGICIDRMDWIHFFNRQRDDGVTWYKGKPARSQVVSWHEMMDRLGPLMHDAGKVIYGNPHYARLDLMNHVDGIYDEAGHLETSLNLCAWMAIHKPIMEWTNRFPSWKTQADALFQRHLHMGAYLTAPVPGNDHAIRPHPESDQAYLDYGPLLDALRGKRWVLLPHVVRVEGDKALANVFEIPGGYVVPVTFGAKESSVQVVLQGLPELPGQKGFQITALHPGVNKPVELATTAESANLLKIDVPLQRGCAVLVLRHTWMEPQRVLFDDTLEVRLGSTLPGSLHYTLDGSQPTSASPRYTAPIKLERTTVVKAAAFDRQSRLGAVLEREYIKIPLASPKVSPAGGFFDDAVEVTVVAPQPVPGESIHYTLDGTDPTPESPEYTAPVQLDRSARFQAARFTPEGAGLRAIAEFHRRGPKPPPPDIHLTDLTPVKATTNWGGKPRWNRSIGDNPLRLGGKVYARGVGVCANSELQYELKPEYRRFVAVLGVDDAMQSYRQGTVVFEIWIDGECLFHAPVMRPGDYTYADLAIPPGSRRIRLLALCAGDGITCDHADWADAGFLVHQD